MAQSAKKSKSSMTNDTTPMPPPWTDEQHAGESQPKGPVFTILRPNTVAVAGSSSSSINTLTETTPAASQQPTSEGSTAQEQHQHQEHQQQQVAGLTRSLEGLEMDDETSTNASDDMALDEFLLTALKNRQDRIFLLKLDREFCSFLNNPSQEQLEFPSLNSYYRMVIHRVANYFKITRHVDPQQKKIILYKTEQSSIPLLRFSDLVEEEEEQPVKPMKLLKRNPNRPSSGLSNLDGSSEPDRKTISIKEREEAYAKARARIFQEEIPAKARSEGSESNSRSDSPSVSTPSAAESSRLDAGDDSAKGKGGTRKQTNGKKTGSGSVRSLEEQSDGDYRQLTQSSLPNSRNVSRSTSPSPPVPGVGLDMNPRNMAGKGLGPKTKPSKTDLTAECADPRRRKSTTSNASSSSGTIRTPVGLARTISSSSSQDGFQSPSIGNTLTESPAVNSPSNSTMSKGYDYFGQNPTSGSGSVSPMSSGSSRASFTYPQPGGPKQHRNHHNSSVSGGNHAQVSSHHNNHTVINNYGHPSSSTGFVKGMNAAVFVPKKPYPKHGNNNHAGGNSGFNNSNINNNNNNNNGGPTSAYQSGSSGQGPPFNTIHNNNGVSSPYTHPQLSTSSPWPERGALPGGHDASAFYNSPQDPNLAFPYGNTLTQYPQSGPGIHQQPFNSNSHHVNNFPNNLNSHHHQQHTNNINHHQHGFHSPSHRGGRRNNSNISNNNPSSKPHFGHQPHFQHAHHARTHPQMHPSQYHQGNHNGNMNNISNNYNASSSRDDFAYSQGSQPTQRYGRPFDGNNNMNNINANVGNNLGQLPPQQQHYPSDFYPNHGMPGGNGGVGDAQSGGQSSYPAFVGQQLTTSPGDISPSGSRYPFNQNWGQGQNHGSAPGPAPGVDPSAMLYNPMSGQPPIGGVGGGKKSFNNNFQHNPSMVQQIPSMMTPPSQGGSLVGNQPPSMTMSGPGSIGGTVSGGNLGSGNGSGGGGQGMYDVERRPPKSAELFDPNGPSSLNSGAGGNGGQGDYTGAMRHSGFNDGGFGGPGGQDAGQTMMMMGGNGGGQASNFHPSSMYHGQSFHNAGNSNIGNNGGGIQQHPHPASLHTQPHHNQHHTQAQSQQQHHHQHPAHVPVGMNRSYSSSSSAGYSGGGAGNSGSTSGPHQHASGSGNAGGSKKNNLLYDYSVLATPSYDGVVKSNSPEVEKSPSLSHILEIHEFDAQDDIFEDLVLPPGSKLRRLNPSARDPVGQCLVVFKNANLATEALVAFQEGKETWMGPEAKLKFDALSSEEEEGVRSTREQDQEGEGEEEGEMSVRIQQRFSVKVWTPVLVNNTTPVVLANAAALIVPAAGSGALASVSGHASPVRTPATMTTPSAAATAAASVASTSAPSRSTESLNGSGSGNSNSNSSEVVPSSLPTD